MCCWPPRWRKVANAKDLEDEAGGQKMHQRLCPCWAGRHKTAETQTAWAGSSVDLASQQDQVTARVGSCHTQLVCDTHMESQNPRGAE